MKVIFNITENKNKATFQQEVVKINTSFNQTQNIVKPKFQTGYYPLPVGLENYYTKNETDLLLDNYYLKSEIDTLNSNTYAYINQKNSELNVQIQTQFLDYYTKYQIDSFYVNYYTKSETYSQTEINGFLSGKQNTIGYTPENSANKSDIYTVSSTITYASTKALVDGLATKLDKGTYTGNAQDLKNAIDSKANTSHTHDISSITNLQTSLDNKLEKGTYTGNAQDLQNSKLDKPTSDGTFLVKKVGSTISYEPFSGGVTKTTFTHNILVADWSLVSGKYEAVISNAGILADSFVDVIPSNDNIDIVRRAQIFPSVLISAGSVKVYSKFLPSGTISVTVNII